MTTNIEARAKLETDLAAAAAANGYNAVTSIDVMPPAFSDPVLCWGYSPLLRWKPENLRK